jgi:carbon storage regulator
MQRIPLEWTIPKNKEFAMLVLSRKLNEKIMIDGGIVVTVVKIDRNQVRLGIEAPGHIRVFREEIAGPLRREGSDSPVTAAV